MAAAVASGLPISRLLHSWANLQGSCHFNGVELIAWACNVFHHDSSRDLR